MHLKNYSKYFFGFAKFRIDALGNLDVNLTNPKRTNNDIFFVSWNRRSKIFFRNTKCNSCCLIFGSSAIIIETKRKRPHVARDDHIHLHATYNYIAFVPTMSIAINLMPKTNEKHQFKEIIIISTKNSFTQLATLCKIENQIGVNIERKKISEDL